MKKMLCLIFSLILTLGVTGCSKPSNGSSDQGNSNGSADVNSTVHFYPEGVYRAGADIPAGEYRLTAAANTSGLLRVFADSDGSDLIESQAFFGNYYITVSDGQVLDIRSAGFAPVSELTHTATADLNEGMYLVGSDCPAGEYRLTAIGTYKLIYCIYQTSLPGIGRQILKNGFSDSDLLVVVEEGQYLFLSGCTGRLQ